MPSTRQQRERRAPSDEMEGFEPGTWDDAEEVEDFRTNEL